MMRTVIPKSQSNGGNQYKKKEKSEALNMLMDWGHSLGPLLIQIQPK